MNVTSTLATLLLIVCPAGAALGQQRSTAPSWQHLQGTWPVTTNQVRAMTSGNGELFIGLAGTVPGSAEVWKLADSAWVRQSRFTALKVLALQTDAAGNLYVGIGTPHSAEVPGRGDAAVWRIDIAGKKSRLRSFPNRDMIYSLVWHEGKLHAGTMTEDRPGTAEIWRFDDPGWTRIAGRGINGWPADNTYAAVYEMWVHDGTLVAGTFSRTMGDGDVLRFEDGCWTDLEIPETIIALSFETYQGQLIATVSNAGERHANPVFTLQTDGTWRPLGTAPDEWEGAYIPNHLVVDGTDLYLGMGGVRGTLSVWKYDGTTWVKLAGDGVSGSWDDPLVDRGAEWIYRLARHRGKLYAGLASDGVPFQAQVWELTP